MLSRRDLFAGLCCLLPTGPALAAGRRRPKFICTAVDQDPIVPERLAATRPPAVRGGTPGSGPRVVFDRPAIMAQATMHPPERWLPAHGSTPGTGVVTLNVHFMNGTQAQQRRVRQIASEWLREGLEQRIRFVFGTTRRGSHIRIRFDGQGPNSSEVGAKARAVPESRPTMKLAETSRRVVLHEFGHALGLRHEHHHPQVGIVWNRRAVIADLRSRGIANPQAWAENNLFTRFTESHSCEGSNFDRNSVMLYPVDRTWTLNGFSSGFNENISTGDRRCLVRVYRIAAADPNEQDDVAACALDGAAAT